MNTNQKGFNKVILVGIAILLIAGGYYIFTRNFQPTDSYQEPTLEERLTLETQILTSLKSKWPAIQTSIPFRPSFHNQAEDAAKIWRIPSAVQFLGRPVKFIGTDNILVRVEDDNNVHTIVFKWNGALNLEEVLKNQGEFTLSDWKVLAVKYGDPSYQISTYTIDVVRDGKIILFPDLTKVPENIFMKNYWEVSFEESNFVPYSEGALIPIPY